MLETTKLKSAFYELKDEGASKEQKRGAWQRIYGFLRKMANTVGDVDLFLLTKYIKRQMIG
ncbi:MAG: hypothetical protein GY710_11215 [Desulfobacteraceae bacterium]|nr:hypothetical protein [Desulfobacteraceae bacterium]